MISERSQMTGHCGRAMSPNVLLHVARLTSNVVTFIVVKDGQGH